MDVYDQGPLKIVLLVIQASVVLTGIGQKSESSDPAALCPGQSLPRMLVMRATIASASVSRSLRVSRGNS